MKVLLAISVLLAGCSNLPRDFWQSPPMPQQRQPDPQWYMLPAQLPTPQPPAAQQRPGVALLRSSHVSGQNRICIYDRLGSREAHTVALYEQCPLNK